MNRTTVDRGVGVTGAIFAIGVVGLVGGHVNDTHISTWVRIPGCSIDCKPVPTITAAEGIANLKGTEYQQIG